LNDVFGRGAKGGDGKGIRNVRKL